MSAKVGNDKENLDSVGDLNILLHDIVKCFGRFLKIYVEKDLQCTTPTVVNGLSVIMATQQQLFTAHYPNELVVKNKHDQLFNDILTFLKSRKCEWMSDEVHSGIATNSILSLRNALWYVDGSHSTLNERSCEVPDIFSQFSGYNIPEASKHRKRSPSSLSREDLLALSQKLFSILHHQIWMRVNWIELKSPVTVLAQSLSKYAEYLANKRVRMQEIHTSSDTTRSVGENLTVCFTKARSSHPPYLQPVIDTVTAAGLQNPVELGPLLPVDRRRRYDWLEAIRQGVICASYSGHVCTQQQYWQLNVGVAH